jgi:hypothetical protein
MHIGAPFYAGLAPLLKQTPEEIAPRTYLLEEALTSLLQGWPCLPAGVTLQEKAACWMEVISALTEQGRNHT